MKRLAIAFLSLALIAGTIATVAASLLTVALLAALIPAARVLRVDPIKTLRCD